MKTSILAAVAVGFLFVSCGNTSNEKSNEQTETATHEEHQHENETQTIQLNNGEKWIVNEEMKPFVLEAENILSEYLKSNSSDYKTLAEHLKEKNSGLIKSCTMKGKSHNELHKWLLPHIELIEKLEKCANNDEANIVVAQLNASFKNYNQYFQ
jgi:uncharacterized protein YlzI (FlbEa/FlbD family)